MILLLVFHWLKLSDMVSSCLKGGSEIYSLFHVVMDPAKYWGLYYHIRRKVDIKDNS